MMKYTSRVMNVFHHVFLLKADGKSMYVDSSGSHVIGLSTSQKSNHAKVLSLWLLRITLSIGHSLNYFQCFRLLQTLIFPRISDTQRDLAVTGFSYYYESWWLYQSSLIFEKDLLLLRRTPGFLKCSDYRDFSDYEDLSGLFSFWITQSSLWDSGLFLKLLSIGRIKIVVWEISPEMKLISISQIQCKIWESQVSRKSVITFTFDCYVVSMKRSDLVRFFSSYLRLCSDLDPNYKIRLGEKLSENIPDGVKYHLLLLPRPTQMKHCPSKDQLSVIRFGKNQDTGFCFGTGPRLMSLWGRSFSPHSSLWK